MKVASTRLCCVVGTMLLTTTLFAQTTMIRRTVSSKTKSSNREYVPYDRTSSIANDYKRRSAPAKTEMQTKNVVDKVEVEEDKYAIKRAPKVFAPERKIVAEKTDTVSSQLYSQTVEKENTEIVENKEVRAVVNKTLPLSFFQQNGSLK